MEALRAAITAAQRAGTLLMMEFRDWNRDSVQKRLDELEGFSEICDRIDLSPVLRRDRDTGASVKRCADSVSDIQLLLEEIRSFKKDHTFRYSWKSIVSKDMEEEIIRLFNRLQREKASLELQIAAAISDARYQMGEEHDRDLAAVENQSTESSTVGTVGFSEDEVNGFLGAVFITDSSDERSALVSAKGERVDGTCSWILETDAYNTWMDTPCPGLWITGGAGMGKSMMSIFLTEHLEMKAKKSATESVIYFFCDGQREMMNCSRGILRGLISQLVVLNPSLSKHGIFEEKHEMGSKTYNVRFESLCRTFNNMVEDLDAGCVYCVIDGLDECGNTCGELVNSLLGVRTSRFKPIILSRALSPSLKSSLSKYVRLRLEIDAEKEVKADLSTFIQQRVQQLSDNGGYPPTLQQVFHDTLMKRSEGTFLWVDLAAQELKTRPLADVETCLNSLPSGLNGIYSRILERLDPVCVRSVSRLLSVVTTVYNPMKVKEVECLLSIQPTAHLTASEVTESLVAQCGGLLILMDHPILGKRVIRLAHQSVKDYLFRPSPGSDHGLEAFRFERQKAHLQLAGLCLDMLKSLESLEKSKYLSDDIRKFRETESRVQTYAINRFKDHAIDSGVKWFVSCFGSRDIYHEDGQFVQGTGLEIPLFISLCYEAELDLEHGAHHDGFCSLNTDSVMKLLLKAGSDVNRGDHFGILPLHIAVRRNSVSHTRLLLQWGANPNLANYWGFKPLHYIAGDQEEITVSENRAFEREVNVWTSPMKFFHKADYQISKAWGDARGRLIGETPYRFRNEKESIADIQEILECFKSSGANLNVQAADGTTPLMCCAYRNKPTCLVAAKWLIAAGADVNMQDDHGNSCLHLAVVQRKRSLVAALVDAGANQELQNDKGMTPAELIQLRPEFWEVLETEVKVEEVE
ncbi:ankyrin repeat protein [Colletotrichum chrysophilum]|uniref:Ankyrin repeat protein n=1 Tax=Colletotrichum chrysophilum TaxID=1836956 RepID=A0AAD9A917_9PEZI|nr:ankyrin repeat protein [Colletotrichum chrysophilum]